MDDSVLALERQNWDHDVQSSSIVYTCVECIAEVMMVYHKVNHVANI